MKKLKTNCKIFRYIICSIFLILFSTKSVTSSEVLFTIKGNKFTDSEVILSLLKEIPKDTNIDYSNDIIKTLNESNLFSNIEIQFEEKKYIIIVQEFPNINQIKFINNDRLKDEDLETIVNETNFNIYNLQKTNLFIDEIKKIYQSFGYNNVKISYEEKINNENNSVNLIFDIKEGTITKINSINIQGNISISAQEIISIINSKTKSLRNIFANNNFKPTILVRDNFIISAYYKDKGFIDVDVQSKVEYLQNNKVNIYFTINEGNIYSLSSINISDNQNILSKTSRDLIKSKRDKFISSQNYFSASNIKDFRNEISNIIINSGIDFFEINTLDQVDENKVNILLEIIPINPKYTKNINIVGNNRTYDYVIRRELDIAEGDAFSVSQLKNLRNKLVDLNLFESVNIKEEAVDDSFSNLIIEVKEKQTGSFNAGVSVGTLDGFAIVTGLKERNFYGTGRSLDVLLNTSDDNNELKIVTSDRLSYENEIDIRYKINYKQRDYSESSSYKLDTFSSGVGIGYKINQNFFHNFDLEYVLKDYNITNSSTASQSILDSSGGNMSYLIKNNFRFSTLNPGFVSRSGNYINFNNTIETPTSSGNGYIRNIVTLKKYYSSSSKNIFGIQSRIGNIFSLNNNDILTDDKFALGGRWLRGFDNYGAGPRNSRTSYIGGNNLFVTKLDYSYEISNNSNFPIFLNLFNDYGLVWENKTKPTNNDNSLRSSAGFGIRYYSPIGPIGFSWGFPIMDKEYDIKRMFIFSIGNID
tara:strand:- start:730 stop:3003 length:2274 start_codon:yes stop_codon:yes gene_type:complete